MAESPHVVYFNLNKDWYKHNAQPKAEQHGAR